MLHTDKWPLFNGCDRRKGLELHTCLYCSACVHSVTVMCSCRRVHQVQREGRGLCALQACHTAKQEAPKDLSMYESPADRVMTSCWDSGGSSDAMAHITGHQKADAWC